MAGGLGLNGSVIGYKRKIRFYIGNMNMPNKKYTQNRLGSFDLGHNLTATPYISWNMPDLWMVIITKSRELVKEMRAQMKEEESDDDILVPTQQFIAVLASDVQEAVREAEKSYHRNKVKYTPKPKEGDKGEREEKGKEDKKGNERVREGGATQRKQRGASSDKS
jgi:hypothetical protein